MSVTFGRYELLSPLATGGMGEVFLARSTGAAGFEKTLVLKRVLPHLAGDAEFKALFLDEARIAARLHHPNIAQIFELGEVEGQWFIVMEYVPGKDLRRLGAAAKARKQPVPLELACRIAADAAAALAYAHQAKDSQGRPLRIVHRDVSPHNLLVSFAGVVKLIDFGVSRATTRLLQTGQGSLRGKYPYMSPEQVVEGALDHRSDQFSLGVVLWELLTGRRLFPGESDAATLQRVAECRVERPSTHRPVPAALEDLALRMLEKEPSARWPDCGAVRQALEDFLLEAQRPSSPAHLARWMQELFPEDQRASTDVGQRTVSSRQGSGDRSAPAPKRGSEDLPVVAPPGERPRVAVPSTSFVGRRRELEALRQLLAGGERLITLVGPSGAGTTRLATQLALDADGPARLADLTGASDQESACAAVAGALGLAVRTGDDAEEAVGRALAERGEGLLVLDGFEPALAAGTVGRWREAAKGVTFVVTAAEPLGLPGEVLYEVPPLEEAEELFFERAQAARPGWKSTEADRAAVKDLVERLAGLPLAIELAAAHLATLTPAHLVQRLPLAGAPCGTGEREETLRRALDWSWELLQPHEQLALAQLGVFHGGFDLEAVEAVVDLSAFTGAPWPLDVVQTLKERSLVRASESGAAGEWRFGLLASVRDYAREKLEALGDAVSLGARERHARYFLAQAPPGRPR